MGGGRHRPCCSLHYSEVEEFYGNTLYIMF
jgi:hypothetical protein